MSYEDVNWSDEMATAVKTTGKAALKLVGYIFNILMTVCLICAIAGTVVGITFLVFIKNNLDTSVDGFDLLASDKSLTTRVAYVDKTGEIVEMESERLSAAENRVWVSYDEMGYSEDTKYIVKAIVAIEDKRFFEHSGVDWYRTVGCTLRFFTGSSMQGASTITQQLIKNITGEDDTTIQRKVQEIFRALALEKKYEKSEILEMYLNNIYLSEGCYGVGAAAYTYFGKEVKDLTLIEAAAIAAITQNPYRWDPYIFPENNAKRRNDVLDQMLEQNLISQEEYNGAYGRELVLSEGEEGDEDVSGVHSWYTDAAQSEAISLLASTFGYTRTVAEKMLLTGGYTIVTAQDPEIQDIIEEYYEDMANFQSVDKSPVQPESSFVVIDPDNGNVLGLVGGRGKKSANLVLNYATQTKRPAGSSFKPISVYAPGLEYGAITYGTVFDDAPINFGTEKIDKETGDIIYTTPHGYPYNSPDEYRGLTTVNEGVKRSINTIAWQSLQKLGVRNSFDFVTNKVGISTLVEDQVTSSGKVFSDVSLAPLALGQQTYGVTLKEMTAAYQIFVTGGVYNEERIVLQILDQDGNVIVDNEKKSSIVMSAQNASIMSKMLEQVVAGGTARSITLDKKKTGAVDCAGKTGTSENAQDYWFIGYTPYYVAGVWFGYSMPRSMSKFSSIKTTIPAWDKIMTKITQKYVDEAAAGGTPLKSFSLAPGVVACTYCKDSGKLMTDACRADPRGSRAETGYFVAGTEPTEYCTCHVLVDYDASTEAIATDGCVKAGAKIKQVGLLNVYRAMPFNILIADSQYTMQTLSEGYSYEGLTESMPFYQNLLPLGRYAGHDYISAKSVKMYNSVCLEHLHFLHEVEEEPTEEPTEEVGEN